MTGIARPQENPQPISVHAPPANATPDPIGAIRRGATLLISSQLIKLALQLGSTAILARLLMPADFGLISLVTPLVAFFTVFRDVGLSSATITMPDISHAEVSSLFWINTAIGVLLGLLLVGSAPWVAEFYSDPRLAGMLRAMALTFLFNGIAAQYQAFMQRSLRFRALTTIDVSSNLIGTAIGLVAAFMGYGYWSLVLMPVATQAVNLIITVPSSHWHPGKPRWESRTGAMAQFGSHVAGFNILNYFSRNLDNLLIGKVWGIEALGYYGRAYTLMMLPLSQVIYPLAQVVVPVLSRIQNDQRLYLQTYKRIVQVIMFVCAPMVTAVIVGRVWIIDIVLGQKWLQIAPIFLALGVAGLVQPVNNSVGWLMISQGQSKQMLTWGLISSAITVLFILLGLPFGPLAVAASYSFGQVVVLTPLMCWYGCRNQRVSMRDVFSIATPYWIVSALSGLSFALLEQVVSIPADVPAAPLIGLVFAFAWVSGIQIGVFALHPAGRKVLSSIVAVARRRSIDALV